MLTVFFTWQLWNNIHTAYADQPDSVELARTLSQNFESMFEKEVCSYSHLSLSHAHTLSLSLTYTHTPTPTPTHTCHAGFPSWCIALLLRLKEGCFIFISMLVVMQWCTHTQTILLFQVGILLHFSDWIIEPMLLYFSLHVSGCGWCGGGLPWLHL